MWTRRALFAAKGSVFTVLFYSFISMWWGSGWLQNWDWLSSPQLLGLVYIACYSRALGPWVYIRTAHSTAGGWDGVCLCEDKERIQLSCWFVILSLGLIVIPLLPALIEKHDKSITSISGLFVVSWLGFRPDLKRQKCRQAFNAAMDEYTAFMTKVCI